MADTGMRPLLRSVKGSRALLYGGVASAILLFALSALVVLVRLRRVAGEIGRQLSVGAGDEAAVRLDAADWDLMREKENIKFSAALPIMLLTSSFWPR